MEVKYNPPEPYEGTVDIIGLPVTTYAFLEGFLSSIDHPMLREFMKLGDAAVPANVAMAHFGEGFNLIRKIRGANA